MSIKEKFQNLASSGLNKLSPSANLFLRYYTGLGSKGLDLKMITYQKSEKKLNQLINIVEDLMRSLRMKKVIERWEKD